MVKESLCHIVEIGYERNNGFLSLDMSISLSLLREKIMDKWFFFLNFFQSICRFISPSSWEALPVLWGNVSMGMSPVYRVYTFPNSNCTPSPRVCLSQWKNPLVTSYPFFSLLCFCNLSETLPISILAISYCDNKAVNIFPDGKT